MPVRFRTPDGRVQFSTQFANYCLAAKGTITSYSSWASPGISLRVFSISYNSTGYARPLCAVRGGAFLSVTNSGTTYTFSFLLPSTVSTLDYYIFDQLALMPALFGMNVWSDAWQLIYSSDYKPLRVRDVVKGSCGFLTDAYATNPNKASSESFFYESGRDYLPILARPSFAKSYLYQGAGNYRLSTWIVSAGPLNPVVGYGISQGMTRYSAESATTTEPNPALQRFALSRGILVADVTNF
ncbi:MULTISPECIES: hypothetical protein [unclassified Sphingobium]|uniref:hypothetical protein n=1 Tax=unclassified Sphingobium TaxID=2611147 RepID=UPI0022258733|nr:MULTISPECIES: hypothetical protein [unclassified Sphingobium]MCW2395897.1 hypothetical protein [Sphingobium sp. B8D3B]MCW2419413.1 hypothetical protein [Sphingobium sp. B8D3C]